MTWQPTRRTDLGITAGGVAVALAGCIGGGDARTDAQEYTDMAPSDVALPLTDHAVPLGHDLGDFESSAVSGGVDKGGIPSIDEPSFGDAGVGDDMLGPGEPVFGIELDGEARAYPQRVLVHHEIVNNNLLVYDRETHSWFPQVLGTGVLGALTGHSLRERRLTWTSWERWRDVHPDTDVLTTDTGYGRNYDDDLYGAYDLPEGYYADQSTLFESMHTDDRHPKKDVFVGARSRDGAVAFRNALFREQPVLEATVGETPYLGVYDPELDTAYVYPNPENRRFEADGNSYVGPDDTRHPPADLPLESIRAFDAMWFAWVAFYPETAVVSS